MLVVGKRLIPWILHRVVHLGSRELFRLAVLAIALGVALGASELFGVSFALGAFFAGMIMGESELSHQAANETLPLRDAFAVLFFVSVGMLFDPMTLVRDPWPLLGALGIVVVGKSLAARADHEHVQAAARLVRPDRRQPRADRRILLHPRRPRRRPRPAAGGRPAT